MFHSLNIFLKTLFFEKKALKWFFFFLLQAVLYLYFITSVHRSEMYHVLFLFIFLFASYFLFLTKLDVSLLKIAVAFAIIFRVVMLCGLPWLSDDFYRFLWDGYLSYHGINPYLYTPQELVDSGFMSPFSITLMNSPSFYTVYPPFGQFTFFIANYIAEGNVLYATLVMKIQMLCAELGTLYFLSALLKTKGRQTHILIYALNPLIIIEFVGNLHAEGFAIFFLVFAFWLIEKKKLVLSSIAFALAVCSKLLPLLLLPSMLWLLGFRKAVCYTIAVCFFTIISFLPFWDTHLFLYMSKSLKLYFNDFEFNASFYYLFKWMHWEVFEGALYVLKGLFLVVFFLIWYLRRGTTLFTFLESVLFIFIAYLFSTQSIHPWYIGIPLFLSVFSTYRFPLVWTFLSIFTYVTYQTEAMQQQMWVVFIEYVLLFAVMAWELSKKRSLFLSF